MGLINWDEEMKELRVFDSKEEIRRDKEYGAVDESIPKGWEIDPLLAKKQILEVENLGEEISEMVNRINHLTGVYAERYRSVKEKWERKLMDQRQFEAIDLWVLETNEKIDIASTASTLYEDEFHETIKDTYRGEKDRVQDEYNETRGRLKKSMQGELTGLISEYQSHMEACYPKEVFRKQYEIMDAELDIDLQKRKKLESAKYNIAIGRVFMHIENGYYIDDEFGTEAQRFLREAYPMISDWGWRWGRYGSLDSVVFPYFIQADRGMNLLLSYRDSDEDKTLSEIVNAIGLRFVLNIPAYLLKFCLVDGTGIGTFSSIVSVDPAQDKTKSNRIKGIITDGEVRSREAQIRDTISGVRTELSGMTQSLREHNCDNRFDIKPYRMQMIQHFPQRIDRETIENLTALSGMTGKMGYSSVITVPKGFEEEAKEEIRQSISAIRANMVELRINTHPRLGTYLCPDTENDESMSDVSSAENMVLVIDGQDKLSNKEFLDELKDLISEEVKKYERRGLMYADIMPGRNDRFRKSAAFGVGAVLGQYLKRQPFVLNFNDSYVHTVVSGMPGVGKSNLLTVVVTDILQNYRPDEIEIFMVDYKHGVDYSALSDARLPQLRMISLAKEPAFVNLVLDKIGKEIKNRSPIINEYNNIDDYNRRHPEAMMKRIIVIVDELYQLLKEAKQEQVEEILSKISEIAYQGRAFGVHLILASQQMTSLDGIEDVIKMCHNRIIFDTKDDLSRFVDSGTVSEARELLNSIGPEDKGACIFSNDGGRRVEKCLVAKLGDEEQKRILEEIEQECGSESEYTRVLLDQPFLCKRHPFTEFCRNGKVVAGAEHYKQEIRIREPFFLWIGQTLESSTAWGVEAPDGSIWMIGGDGKAEKAGMSVMFYALVSLVMEKLRRRLKGENLTIMYCDALDESIGLETEDDGFVRNEALCGKYWDYYPGLGWNEDGEETGLPECIMKLSEEVEKRCEEKSGKEASGLSVSFEPVWMLINRMEVNTRFGPRHMDALRKAVRKGKEVNVHVIVWTKTPDRIDEIKLYEEARNPKVLQTLVLETSELKEFRMDRQGLEASGYQAQLIAPAGKGKRLRIYELSDKNREDAASRLYKMNQEV